MTAVEERLGIDIGNVIVDGSGTRGRADTSMLEEYLRTPQMDGAFEAITLLNNRRFKDRIWLVSKARARMQAKSTHWLRFWKFFETTGIAEDRLRFCLERPEKAVICGELGITHFVDDRLDVLDAMDGIVPNRYLFRPEIPEYHAVTAQFLSRHNPVRSWHQLLQKLGA